ncbi:MAG: insulinase family protein, partial [Anaerolineaceae bacterium]|nr:insulinase family protein [Anaerolineaceae bacterium]
MNSINPSLWKSLPSPEDIFRAELENGVIVLSRSNFDCPSVVINGYLLCGSQSDSDEKLGLADFTALTLMRGSQRRTFQEIYDALESVGATLSLGASVHTTSFGGRSLVEDLPLLLGLLSECIRHPVFLPEQVEKVRAQLLTALAIRAQDTSEMASLTFDRLLFKDHPYGRPEDGYPDSIQAITRADLEAFHRQHYGPSGMVIVVVGGVTPEAVIEMVSGSLGEWRNPLQPQPPL